MPLILKAVERFALTVEDMHLGTAKGPMRLVAPVSFTMLCAANMAEVDGPPEPATRPVRGLLICASSSPASLIA